MSDYSQQPLTALYNSLESGLTRDNLNRACRAITRLGEKPSSTPSHQVEINGKDDINQVIKKLSLANPPPMIRPVKPPSKMEELSADKLAHSICLNSEDRVQLINCMARSVKYHPLAVIFYGNSMYDPVEDRIQYAEILEISSRINAYCLLRNPIRYESTINDNTVVIQCYNKPMDSVIETLDSYIPYWRDLPDDVGITGPLIYHLLQEEEEPYNTPCQYAATYYDLRNHQREEDSDITALSFYFPRAEGGYYKYERNSYCDEDDHPIENLPLPMANVEILWLQADGYSSEDSEGSEDWVSDSEIAQLPLVTGTIVEIAVFNLVKLRGVVDIVYNMVKGPGIELTCEQSVYTISMSPYIPEGIDDDAYVNAYLSFRTIKVYCTSESEIFSRPLDNQRGYLNTDTEYAYFFLDPSMVKCLYSGGKLSNYYTSSEYSDPRSYQTQNKPLDLLAHSQIRGCTIPRYLETKEVEKSLDNYQGVRPCGFVPSPY